MTITAISQIRQGDVTIVTVTSDLTPGSGQSINYYWYRDGSFVERTVTNENTFILDPGDEVRIDVVDSLDPALDPTAIAPAGYPDRRSVLWVRADATDVAQYRVEQRIVGGTWASIATLAPTASQWSFSVLSPRLTDLTPYEWRVFPIDEADNDGTAITLDQETIVRTPDAPDFTVTFDPATTRVTFAEAA